MGELAPGWSDEDQRIYEDNFLPDCAEEALASTPAMTKRCVGCPGLAGTDANGSPLTMRMLADCKRRRFPFFCHMTRKDEFCTHLCAEWVSAISTAPLPSEKEEQN